MLERNDSFQIEIYAISLTDKKVNATEVYANGRLDFEISTKELRGSVKSIVFFWLQDWILLFEHPQLIEQNFQYF